MNHQTTDDRLQMTDEGGLFKINNDTFTFIVEMEMKSHQLINIFKLLYIK